MQDFLEKYIYPLARLERFIYPIALFIGAFALFQWYWTTTPSYAVTTVIDSVRKHDVQTLEKYVDVDSMASHAFDDLVDGPAHSELLSHMDTFVGAGFVRFFKHEIVGIAHERLRNAVADPKVNIESIAPQDLPKRNSSEVAQAMSDFGLNRSGFRGMKYLDVRGSYALLGIEFFSPKLKSPYTVEFRMEDVGGYWRFTQCTNLNDLVSMYLQSREDDKQTGLQRPDW